MAKRVIKKKFLFKGELMYEYGYRYDSNGRLLSIEKFNTNTPDSELIFSKEYDQNTGLIVGIFHCIDNEDNLITNSHYIYDENGKLKEFRYFDDIVDFKADKNGRIIETLFDGQVSIYKRDDNGKLIHYKVFSQNDEEIVYLDIEFIHCELGILTAKFNVFNKNTVNNIYTREYDYKNKRILKEMLYSNDSIVYIINWVYNNDDSYPTNIIVDEDIELLLEYIDISNIEEQLPPRCIDPLNYDLFCEVYNI